MGKIFPKVSKYMFSGKGGNREMEALKNAPCDLESVVACDLYESPVDVLKRKFH